MSLDYADLQSIKNLMFTYACRVDQRDHEQLSQLFSKGAIKASAGDEGEELRGGEAIKKAYDRNNKVMPDGSAGTKHIVTNIIIDPAQNRNDVVLTESYFSVYQANSIEGIRELLLKRRCFTRGKRLLNLLKSLKVKRCIRSSMEKKVKDCNIYASSVNCRCANLE